MPALVLDFFGTIVSLSSLADAYRALARWLSERLPDPPEPELLAREYARELEALHAEATPSFTLALRRVAGRHGLALGEAEAWEAVRRVLVPRLKPYPDAVEALTVAPTLYTGVAVASDGEMRVVEEALRAMQLDHYIDAVAASDEVGKPKPDPAVVLLALERLGVAPGEAVAAGDSPKDVEAARRAGLAGAGLVVRRPLRNPGAPDALACDLVSLVRMLSTLA